MYKVKVFEEFGALNSPSVFEAFKAGVIANGDELVNDYDSADVIVIWSVLFAGRMAGNKEYYDRAKKDGKPVVVLEIGNLRRGESWRVGLNGINRTANFGTGEIDPNRKELFGIELKPWNLTDGGYITICTQRGDSLQWEGKESISDWVQKQIETVRKYSNRAIVIRPHPRQQESFTEMFAQLQFKGIEVFFDVPQTTGKDKVNFEDVLNYSYAIINHSAGPGVQAAIQGTPVVVSEESLAFEVGINIEDIENPNLPDREKWFDELVHTEWFESEIESGIPWNRLKQSLL